MSDPSVGFGPLMEAAKSALSAGNFAEAEALYARALGTGEQLHGTDDLSLVSALTGLGTTRVLSGRAEAGEPVLTRALAISETRLGAGHPNVALLLNELSRLYLKQSAYSFAEPLLMRLLALKRAKGDDHPEVATVLASLGVVHHALGRYETAEAVWRKVVDIRERTLAPNHFSIATALEHLAETCAARGKADEALQFYSRALDIRQSNLGTDHPSVITLRDRIADIQLQLTEGGIEMLPAPQAIPGDGLAPLQSALSVAAEVRPAAEPQLRKTIQRVIPLPQMLTPPAGAAAQNGSYQNVILDIQRELEDEPEEQPQTGFAATIGAAVTGFRQRALSSSIVLGVVTMLLIAWGVAGAKKRGSPEWVSQATLAKSPPTDSTRIGGTTETLGRPLGVDFGTKAAADSVPTLESRPGPARNSIIIESSSSPGPVAPVVVIPSISLQAQSRIDSAIHAADAPRQTAAEALRDQLTTADAELRTSLQSTLPTRARLIGDPPAPQYPASMSGLGLSGRVVVRFDVDTLGHPVMRTFRAVQSPSEAFTDAVRKVIPQMRFEPARLGGLDSHATSEEVQIGFSFVRPTN